MKNAHKNTTRIKWQG